MQGFVWEPYDTLDEWAADVQQNPLHWGCLAVLLLYVALRLLRWACHVGRAARGFWGYRSAGPAHGERPSMAELDRTRVTRSLRSWKAPRHLVNDTEGLSRAAPAPQGPVGLLAAPARGSVTKRLATLDLGLE